MIRFNIVLALVLCFLSRILFFIFPNLDIELARYFYNSSTYKFIGVSNNFLGLVHRFIKIFPIFISIIAILLILRSIIFYKFKTKYTKSILYIILCLWIGPGLVVNYIFKNHWGRPRPVMIKEFNGNKVFKPSFVISSECNKNCSFVCGDASIGFWFFALIPLSHTKQKKIMICIFAVFAGTALGLMRMLQGGHFFSDVVFSGIFVYISIWIIYGIMYYKKEY